MPQGWFSTSKAAGLIIHGTNKTKMVQKTVRDIRKLEHTLDDQLGFINCGSLTIGPTSYHDEFDGYII